MTVKELRTRLTEAGYGKEIESMGKKELQSFADKLNTFEKTLENVQEIPTEVQTEDENAEKAPTPIDSEWTDYVLSKLTEQEKDPQGNPKVDGLRRVAELLLGSFSILSNVVKTPTFDSGATVVVTLEFVDRFGQMKIIQGAADVSTINTVTPYCHHPVATAETRAEGRALRKALKLVGKLAAEELQNADPDEPSGTDGRIPNGMINGLKMMCNKLNLDLDRIAEREFKSSVADLTRGQGLKIGKIVSQYNSGEREIEDDVKAIAV